MIDSNDHIRSEMRLIMRKSHHVVPNDNGWGIKKSGGKKSIQNFETKREAEVVARTISKNQNSELVIHGKNGRIQRSDSHGNDPCPPRDKR